MDDNAAPLRWIKKSGRSKRPRPHWSDDEYDAALSLLLLSESGGGFCNSTAADPKTSPPKPNQETATRSPLIIKIKMQKTASPDTPLRPPPAYACSMCDRVFGCSQALGGHMTLHRAKKGKAVAVTLVVSDDHHHNSGRVHECLACHEAFDSGQALGGHMRKHYDKSKLARKGGSSASGSGESSSDDGGATARPMLMFDLNLPAPPE